jgi:hypothetical protein
MDPFTNIVSVVLRRTLPALPVGKVGRSALAEDRLATCAVGAKIGPSEELPPLSQYSIETFFRNFLNWKLKGRIEMERPQNGVSDYSPLKSLKLTSYL